MQKLHRTLNYSDPIEFLSMDNGTCFNSIPILRSFFSYISFYSHALALDFLTLTVFEYLLIPSLIRERNGRWRACLDVQEEQLRGEKNFIPPHGRDARYNNNIFHDFFFFLLLNQTRQFPKLNVTEFKVCFRGISISRTSLTFCVFIFFQRDRIKFFFYSMARTYTLRHYKRCIFQLIRDALAKDYP